MGLKILKENEEGFGILVEGDAGSVSEVLQSQIIKEEVSGAIDLSGPIYYYATLQKFGVENRNKGIFSIGKNGRWCSTCIWTRFIYC